MFYCVAKRLFIGIPPEVDQFTKQFCKNTPILGFSLNDLQPDKEYDDRTKNFTESQIKAGDPGANQSMSCLYSFRNCSQFGYEAAFNEQLDDDNEEESIEDLDVEKYVEEDEWSANESPEETAISIEQKQANDLRNSGVDKLSEYSSEVMPFRDHYVEDRIEPLQQDSNTFNRG
ncbi:unnamed protein product [Protopolystoma xenopodis]|uniref:Uncharacterized protein n=1 Tax=Protopolystoma xenopodis TaxID=117903 RepID=A0A3S5FE68_9PLAT|nr:unnamed protein product [Protopolystoma xenopodis]